MVVGVGVSMRWCALMSLEVIARVDVKTFHSIISSSFELCLACIGLIFGPCMPTCQVFLEDVCLGHDFVYR